MLSSWTIYWILKLDDVRDAVAPAALFGLSGGVLAMIFACVADQDCEKDARRYLRRAAWTLLPIGIISACAFVLLPTTKQAAAILLLPKVANSDFVQTELPADAKRLYEAARDVLLDMAKPKDEKK